MAGNIPDSIYPLVARVCIGQENISEAIAERDLVKLENVFVNDPLVTCSIEDARKLFREMIDNTKNYLSSYEIK